MSWWHRLVRALRAFQPKYAGIGLTALVVAGILIAGIVHMVRGLPDRGTFTAVSVGEHSCGIAGGRAYCWGSNGNGQIGAGNWTDPLPSPTPVDISGVLANKAVTSISSGYYFSCVIADGRAYCWGAQTSGRLGNGVTTGSSSTPVAVSTSGVLSGKDIAQISASTTGTHACVIAAGKVYCWGANSNGQLGNNSTTDSSVPVAVDTSGVLNGKTIATVSTGQNHTCVVDSDGKVYCWGANSNGQLGNNSTTDSSVPVAVDTSGVLNGKTADMVSTGALHTCAAAGGKGYCWGSNSNGRLGDNTGTESHVPVAVYTSGVLSGKTMTVITAGANHTCAVASGQAYCWGYGANGRLGSTSGGTWPPLAVDASGDLASETVTSMATGSANSCIVTANKKAYCWGSNTGGRVGDGTTTDASAPKLVQTSAVVTGSAYRLFSNQDDAQPGSALAATNTSSTLSASGQAFRVRMGVKTRADQSPHFTKIVTGSKHSCGISNNNVYCWGDNSTGELGDGTTTARPLPTLITSPPWGDAPVTDIAVNSISTAMYSCVIAGGKVYCWGSNQYSALGIGVDSATTAYITSPQQALGLLAGKTAAKISAGDGHMCAVASGKAYCWGAGAGGRLGTGSTSGNTVNAPAAVDVSGVLSGKTVTDIGAASGSGCAIADGAAYCWGSGSNGQIGDGSTSVTRYSPVAVSTAGVLNGKTLVKIAGDTNNFVCAVASDSTIYCWGYNGQSQSGNSGTTDSSVPVAATMTALSGKTITSIGGGRVYACVTTSDGKAYCWGQNDHGVLGNNTGYTNNPIPTQITDGDAAGKSLTQIDGGGVSTCAVDSQGDAYCWGENNFGQLGNTTITGTNYSKIPLSVDISSMSTVSGVTLAVNEGAYRLQVATKSAGSCSAQSSGFADVTSSSHIQWNTNASVSNGATISSNANDPTPSGTTTYETYRSGGNVFTNPTAIPAGNTGLWDFSLKDDGNTFNTSYCLRIAYADGNTLSTSAAYAEVKTAPGELSVAVVDNSGDPVANPSFLMSLALIKTTCQSTSGTFGVSNKKLRITNNLSVSGWSVSLAATNGASSFWTEDDTGATYDYNDPSGSPAGCNSGSDGDGIAGQLRITPSGAASSPKSGCSNTGVSFGSDGGYNQGTVDAITLVTGSSGADFNCYWNVTGIGVEQTIPASQPGGSYTLDVTATAVAQ